MLATAFIRAEETESRRLMVIMHGLGDSLESYRTLPQELSLPGLNYLLVNAPQPALGGYAWFDFPGDSGPGIIRSFGQLSKLLDVLREQGFPSEQTMLFGFSQGCTMTWELGIRYPHRFAGCIGISGFMRDPAPLWQDRSAVALKQRFLITHGMLDDLIPCAQAQIQVDFMAAAGVQVVWKEIVKAHTIDAFGEMLLVKHFVESCFSAEMGGHHER
jgi:phospholipase/carboxylesterase